MKKSDINFLEDNKYLIEAINEGAPKHVSDYQAETLLRIAKEINPEITFQIKECQDCINGMITFVYLSKPTPEYVNPSKLTTQYMKMIVEPEK